MSNLFTLRTRGLEATGTNFQSEKVQLCLFYTKQPEHASFLRTRLRAAGSALLYLAHENEAAGLIIPQS